MNNPILSDGKEYISAIRASKKIGYASDYIGQLCRAKKIPGQLIGRTWYVDFPSLLEHKKNRRFGRVKKSVKEKSNFNLVENNKIVAEKNIFAPSPALIFKEKSAEIIRPNFSNSAVFTYENDDRPRLPELVKKVVYKEPVLSSHFVKEAVFLSLALLIALSTGFITLKQTAPRLATGIQQKMDSISHNGKTLLTTLPFDFVQHEKLVATSLLSNSASVFQSIADGFRNIKDFAFNILFRKNNSTNTTLVVNNTENVPPAITVASTNVNQSINLGSLKQDLKTELENYIRIQIGSARPPVVAYSSSPVVASADLSSFKTNEVVPAIYYTVTNQSNNDTSNISSIITKLTTNGSFVKATFDTLCLSADTCRTSWPTGGSGSDFAWTVADYGVSTSTTLGFLNGFISTASSTIDANLTITGNSTTTNATTTNLFTTTASTTNFYGAGLTTCQSNNVLTYDGNGRFGCETDDTGASLTFPFTTQTWGVSTSTTLGFFNGFISNASSTINANLLINGNSTTTNATTTNFFSATASSTNLFSTTGNFSTLTINGSASIPKLSNLTTNGFVKTSGSDGTLSIDTTTYLSTYDPFTHPSYGGAATTSILTLTGGLLSTASTTIDNNLLITGNSTTTNATTTNFFSTTASSTNLFSTLLTVGGNGLLVDSSRNVGIGTTTPWAKLSVTGTAGGTTPLFSISSSTASFSTSTVFHIDSNGKVGIGTTSPTSALSVNGDIYLAAGYNNKINFDRTDTTSYGRMLFLTAGLEKWAVGQRGDDVVANSFTITEGLSGLNRLTIAAGGNTGVGTTSPYAQLSVERLSSTGTVIGADSLTGFTGNLLDLKVASTTKFSVNQSGDLLVTGSSTLQRFTATHSTTTNATTTNFFSTTASTTNFFGAGLATCQSNNVLTYDGNGKFGCEADDSSAGGTFAWTPTSWGVSTSTTLGFLNGFISTASSTIDSNLLITGNSTTTNATTTNFFSTTASSTNLFSSLLTVGGSGLVVDSSRNIGIGTTTPQWLLNPTSATTPQLALSAGAGFAQWTFRNAGGDLFFSTTTVAGTATTSISAFEIAGSGFGTTTLRGLNINGQATSTSNVGYNITTGCYAINNTCVGGGGASLTGTTGQLAYFSGTNTAVGTSTLFISTAMNVGLGTTTPWARLSVAGISGGTSPLFSISSSTSAFATSTVFHIDSNGKVGIGTTSPLAQFTIAGAYSNALRIDNGSGANILTVDSTLSSTDSGIDITAGASQTGNLLNFYSSGSTLLTNFSAYGGLSQNISSTTAVRIQNGSATDVFVVNSTSGSVGIGTTTPWKIFSVNGTVSLAGLTTNTGGVTSALCLDSNNQVTRNTDNETCVASSERYKQNIETLTSGSALETINQLRPVSFEFKNATGTTHFGFIAEEVEKINPLLVSYGGDGLPQSVRYIEILPLLTQATQELSLNLASIASTTATSTPKSQAFTTSFFNNVFHRITIWLADAANGIGDFFANRIRTKELCVGDAAGGETCITKSQLDALLANTSIAGSSGADDSGGATSTPEVINEEPTPPAPTPAEEPAIEQPPAQESVEPVVVPPPASEPVVEEPVVVPPPASEPVVGEPPVSATP